MVTSKKKTSDENQSLDIIIESICKQFGSGTILQGKEGIPGIARIPSGCPSLDRALGGGWPQGRIIEVFGKPSSGKSTICLHAVAEAQKLGLMVAYIDAEYAFDAEYAETLGVNMDSLLISQPDTMEDALNVTGMLLKSNQLGLIIVDSVAAMVPKTEIEGEVGDQTVGLKARLMSQAMRIMTGIISKTNTVVIFINQMRENVNTFGYGSPNTCVSPDTIVEIEQR